MRALSLLVFSLVLPSFAFAYTAVLKNGKSVEGRYIGEDDRTLQIRDAQTGVLLSIKKNDLDPVATAAANVVAPKTLPKSQPQASKAEAPSIVAVARKAKQQRTGNARAYSAEDLSRAPELSRFDPAERSEQTPIAAPHEWNAADEAHWRAIASSKRKAVAAANEKLLSAKIACDRARNRSEQQRGQMHKKVVNLTTLLDEPPECRFVPLRATELESAQNEFDEFQESARHSGVPWAWIE